MNPLLPRKYFTPDVEARVMPDGRLYLYGSNDISGCKDYCSKEYHVFVTDDDKMEHWTDLGVSFRNTKDAPGIPWSPDTPLYAPDAIYRNGKYYLYMCASNGVEGVAVSDRPEGPFTDARPVVGADGTGIDPSVFVDDDGQAYYFWGQYRLKGAKLMNDMATLDMSSFKEGILSENEHGFHEGASVRKRNGKYYLIYTDITRGRATCMSYAVADAPLGPYKRGGVIVDNTYCDPETWNNHGSIAEFRGQWYIFYHRSSQNSITSRRVCAEPIYFREDGSICEVQMTSQGASDPIDAFGKIDASIACRMRRDVCIAPDMREQTAEVNEILTGSGSTTWIENWAEYRNLDFKGGASKWTLRARGKGKASVMTSEHGVVGEIAFCSDRFCTMDGALSKIVSGIHPVWLLFEGKGVEIDSFGFGA